MKHIPLVAVMLPPQYSKQSMRHTHHELAFELFVIPSLPFRPATVTRTVNIIVTYYGNNSGYAAKRIISSLYL